MEKGELWGFDLVPQGSHRHQATLFNYFDSVARIHVLQTMTDGR